MRIKFKLLAFLIIGFILSSTGVNFSLAHDSNVSARLNTLFEPTSTTTVSPNFTVKLRVNTSTQLSLSIYSANIKFDQTKLQVTNIRYLIGGVSAILGGDYGTPTSGSTVNSSGVIRIRGEQALNQDMPVGVNTDLVEITFVPVASQATQQSVIAVDTSIVDNQPYSYVVVIHSDRHQTIVPLTDANFQANPIVVSSPTPTPTVTPTPTPPAAGTPFNLTMTPSTATLQCTNNRYTAEAATYRVSWEGEVGTFRVGEVNRQGFFVDIGNQDPGIPLNQIFSDDLGYFHKFITAGTSTNLADFKGFSTKQSNVIIGTDLQFDPDQVYTIRVCSAPGKCSDPIRLTRAHCSVTPTPTPTSPTPGYVCLYRPIGTRIPGDANNNTRVGLKDYSIWWGQKYGSNSVPSTAANFADFNCNGQIDVGDMTIWEQNFTGENQ